MKFILKTQIINLHGLEVFDRVTEPAGEEAVIRVFRGAWLIFLQTNKSVVHLVMFLNKVHRGYPYMRIY